MLRYRNPVLLSDFSDPDVIRVGGDFFMVASSFNYVPGIPVLHSKNLVEWRVVNYVLPKLPFARFDGVCRGDGAWAPSLRFHDGIYYCVVPFPDEGIYVSETRDPFGEWSPLRPLIVGKGIIDPCPVWTEDGCFLAVAFAKSRAGFNSVIGVYEVDGSLTRCLSDGYRIVYDGHDHNPTIEGPKFYRRGGYYYILAPAGSVKSGWQVALRSREVYGPYESKVVLMQNDSLVNGPHQGALVDLPDGNWAFVHFQDVRPYGRILHLQPVVWRGEWPLCGKITDENIAGTPVEGGDYPVQTATGFALRERDDFCGDRLSLMWQTPANRSESWYSLCGGLRLNCAGELPPSGRDGARSSALGDLPRLFTAKITRLNFTATAQAEAFLEEEGDEVGFAVTGEVYAFVCVRRTGGKNVMRLCLGGDEGDTVVVSDAADGGKMTFSVTAENKNIYEMVCRFSFNGRELPLTFSAQAGRWVGAKLGIYARNVCGNGQSGGYALFHRFWIGDIK